MNDLSSRAAPDAGPVELAQGVYCVGPDDAQGGLYCNAYLIVDGGEAVLIDAGSRPDFSTVMMKIMQAGVAPASISTLVYQHYDPDLCGSVALFEEIINRRDLRILSKRENNLFIRFYGGRTEPECIEALGRALTLPSGRVLRFIPTPYAHTPGSFMTFDEKSSILFTSDLLGSFAAGARGSLLARLPGECRLCPEPLPAGTTCPQAHGPCPVHPILAFHQVEMPCARALRHACERVLSVPAALIAPQHGGIWSRADAEHIVGRLCALEDVGIDAMGSGR